jgi:hypothetical protein
VATFDQVSSGFVWFRPVDPAVASITGLIPVHKGAIEDLGDITAPYLVGPLTPACSDGLVATAAYPYCITFRGG